MSSLLLGDLNDYISPSVACVKPPEPKKDTRNNGDEPVVVNLTDCLACSGCITSSETVLVTQQSYQELYKVLEDDNNNSQVPVQERKRIVVSLSASSRVALCQIYKLSSVSVYRRLLYFFKRVLNIDDVILLDTAFAYKLTLELLTEEFIQKYSLASARCGNDGDFTLFTSQCPGWICYAEKKLSSQILSQISRIKSPDQILGALIKNYSPFIIKNDVADKVIYHVSIQPCFDKKLEASRIGTDGDNVPEVKDIDFVISTGELTSMFSERLDCSFSDLPEEELASIMDFPFKTLIIDGDDVDGDPVHLQRHSARDSSATFLHQVLRSSARVLFDIHVNGTDLSDDARVTVRHFKNEDYTEYCLVRDDDKRTVLLRFASIYGFKNIQTFIQKAKSKKVHYHFVEIMACPGACLFGGGQPKMLLAGDVVDNRKLHRQEMEGLFLKDTVPWRDSSEIDAVLSWVNQDDHKKELLLYASYKSVKASDEKKRPLINVQW